MRAVSAERRARAAGEAADRAASPPEKYLRCLWYDGRRFLKRGIRTRDGARIEIVSPGAWNTGRGPDFLGGVFRLDGRATVCGDVEVHRRRRDWAAHAHRRDPAFGGVRLHVFLLDDGRRDCCRNHLGDPVTELCLRGQTRRPPEEAARLIDPRDYPYRAGGARGRCGAVAGAGGGERLAVFLRLAGKERLRMKIARARRLARRYGREQALYLLILETLGYSAHKGAFRRLSRLLPWRTLRRIAAHAGPRDAHAAVETALLGAAGLIPPSAAPAWDRDTQRAWRAAKRGWRLIETSRGVGGMDPAVWRDGAQRPASAPPRRLAAAGVLFARCAKKGLVRTLLPRGRGAVPGALERRLARLLDGAPRSYWDLRCAWGGRRLRRPCAPIGPEHRVKIVANVLLPFLHLEGRRAAARAVFESLPTVEPDSCVKAMMARLVGGGTPFPRRWGFAAQQGLLCLHRRLCVKDRSGCRRCRLPGLLRGGAGEARRMTGLT